MKIRSYIAIQTFSFIDKSEHLAAGGLHCCLATLSQCQCWPLSLDTVVFTSSPEPPPLPWCPLIFLRDLSPALGTQDLTQRLVVAVAALSVGNLLTNLCRAFLFAPVPVPAPRPSSRTPLCLAHTSLSSPCPSHPQPRAPHSRTSLVLL